MDAVAYLVRLYSTHESILRYTKGVRRERVSPIESASKLSALQSELDEFKAYLYQDYIHYQKFLNKFSLHTICLLYSDL
ncbi:hypothetical protein HDV64DRAFT_248703 [Trichoderma sp. TUCIM 5745]